MLPLMGPYGISHLSSLINIVASNEVPFSRASSNESLSCDSDAQEITASLRTLPILEIEYH